MKNKLSVTQIIRYIIQILSFIFIPGLFILIWNSIGGMYQAIISGTFTFSSMISQILILVSVIPITMFWGRFFCGYICAFGSMQEFINFIAKKLHIKQIKISKEKDKYLKYLKYGILALMILIWTLKVSLDTISPWNVFGIYSSYKAWTDLSSLLTFEGFLLLIIMISSLFIERFFCKYFCPLGGIFSIISKTRLYKIQKNKTRCVNCNMCTRKCAMAIDVNKETNENGKVISGECIDCFKCMDVCNPCSLYTKPQQAVSGTIASVVLVGLYYGGNLATNISGNEVALTDTTTSISQGKYTNGTYEGSAQGFRGTTNVKVVVSNGNISSITIVSYKDDDQFFNRAKTTIINEIISEQSTDVDTVSGATYSSKGIINAVANALNITTKEITTESYNNITTKEIITESYNNTTTNKSKSKNR